LPQFVIAHDQVAQSIRAVVNLIPFIIEAVGAAQAVDNVQVRPGDEDLLALTADVLEELLQSRYALR
jgi:hypothetical protein